MSWLYSQALVEDCLQARCLTGERSALSNWIGIADAYLHSDKMNEASDHSRYGMTFVLLTVDRGAAQLMSYLEGFLVKPTAQRQQGTTQQTLFGLKCGESWQMLLPGTSSPKTFQKKQSTQQQTIANRWVTKPAQFPFLRKTWVQTTCGNDIGYLHTPTTQGNYCAESMQKWNSCRNYKQVFGKVTPESHEYLMGWPIGWTGLKPLEMDRFQQWQSRHSFKSLEIAE
jgi:hypothetical protein